MYKHYVFDIDGTLLDSEAAALPSLRRAALELTGREFSQEVLYSTFGLSAEDAMARLGVEDVKAGRALWIKYIGEYRHLMKIYDGIVPVLEPLKARGASLGIITSKFYDEYERDFIPMGISGYFDTVITASDSATHKPEPGPMLAYLARTGAEPEDVLYIGDTSFDMNCGAGAGTDCALALWGRRDDDPAIRADFRLETPAQILERLRKR